MSASSPTTAAPASGTATTAPVAPTAPGARELLGDVLHDEVVQYALGRPGAPAEEVVVHQVRECLRYLYLVSAHPDRLAGLFLPVEQDIDEIWHYLILQTREYRTLCEERLPGGHFIHHRSIAYGDYQQEPGRETAAEEALRWLPLYVEAFGPFDEDALPHWTIVGFLHAQLGLSLAEISDLGGTPAT
ncbi:MULTISPECIES: glycine-rich domain-containing protein [Streptomyces]|uniref:hypothetical protein n=1 Tax=Streptomyces TaxID=1883 RepID=UPI001CCD3FDF|nr:MULTISPECIES: hypothetical protein [Streptomyces]MCC2268975.1 hypothetical protein [Streptomyces sp. CT1-17]MCM8552062.1 hypothetical protein [Streptomyces sp. STCH 565 A]WFB86709.1 hypothetical protein MMU79_27070 [Streptomyces olivaceus]WGK46307.1 hypothetical protein M6G09_12170 [Streptomyces sp. B146]GHJ03067.1 hypothetical protein TPA0906_49320 [Streptomyces olivaceus]